MRVLLSLLIFLSVCPDELLYERIHKFRLSLLLLCSFNLLSTEIFFVYRESSAAMSYNGLQLPESRSFYHKTSFGELNFRLAQMCLWNTKPRLLGSIYVKAVGCATNNVSNL